jgi:hypothetical protein
MVGRPPLERLIGVRVPDRQRMNLLYLLVNGKVEEAEKWVATITEEPEMTTARELLADYKKEAFFE